MRPQDCNNSWIFLWFVFHLIKLALKFVFPQHLNSHYSFQATKLFHYSFEFFPVSWLRFILFLNNENHKNISSKLQQYVSFVFLIFFVKCKIRIIVEFWLVASFGCQLVLHLASVNISEHFWTFGTLLRTNERPSVSGSRDVGSVNIIIIIVTIIVIISLNIMTTSIDS